MVDRKAVHGISLKCELCTKSFDSEIDLINHSLNHSFDPYFCNICDEEFYVETDLENHLKCHAKEILFYEKDHISYGRNTTSISKCNEKFINQKQISKVQATCAEFVMLFNSPVQDDIVSICDKNVQSEENKQMLKRNFSAKEMFLCVICQNFFSDERTFLNHTLSQHAEQPLYECVVCNNKFPNKQELVNHGQIHLLEQSCVPNEKYGCAVLDDVEENSPKKRCVKVRKLFESADNCQNSETDLFSLQESASDSYNNPIPDVSNLDEVCRNDSSDTIISVFHSKEISAKFSENNSQIFKKVKPGIYEDYGNSGVNNKYHAVQAKTSKKNVFWDKAKAEKKFAKLFNNQRHSFNSEIIIPPSNVLNRNVRKRNSFDFDHAESHCTEYNQEIKQFEVIVNGNDRNKINISSQYLYIENKKNKDEYSNKNNSKFFSVGDAIESAIHCEKRENNESSVRNRISNVKTINRCNEDERATKSPQNYHAETHKNVEDSNDISNIVAVVFDEDSNSVVTTYEVCELEVVDTSNNSSSLQNSETETMQNDFANREIKNAVDNNSLDLSNDKSLESFQGHKTKNTNSSKNLLDKTVKTVQGDIVLTDVTQTEEQTFLSDLLNSQIINEKTVIKHVSPCTKHKTHICHICKRPYSSKLALVRHLYLHSGERPYACNFCDKRFPRKYDLRDHLPKHTGERPYTCPVCGKSFIRQSHVDKHVLIHSDERPYLCDVCGKNFSRKDYLISHRLNHVDDNPFMCSTCDQCFSEREELDAHRETHSVKVCYVCVVCKRRFSQRRHLERHINIHTGEKPFHCDICDKRFSRKDALHTHRKCHTKEQSFDCPDCTKSFTNKRNFLLHMQKHESGKTKKR